MHEQGTPEWLAERAGRVTGSAIATVLMKPETKGYQTYCAQLAFERLMGRPLETFKSGDMLHGSETEARARANYELEAGLTVEEVGFIPHPTLAWAGVSPDGLVGSDGLVEIKCPQLMQHMKNVAGFDIDRNYALQMQWQMECTGREWCDFVSFNPDFPDHLQLTIRRVERDAEVIEELREGATRFLADVEAWIARLDAINPNKEAA